MKTFFLFCAMMGCVMATAYASGSSLSPTQAPGSLKNNSMAIEPKHRAADYKEAFDFLRRERPANKVYIKLIDGAMITNIIDIHLMGSSTLFMLRFNTPNGIKTQAVELEHIEGLGCLE